MNSQNNHKAKVIRMVLLTSLPSFVLAETFFAFLYFLVISGVYWLQYLFSIANTAQIEANMDIFSIPNIIIFIIGMSLISVIMCMEILTIIAITTYDYYRNDHIPLRALITYSFGKMRSFLRLRSAPFFLFLFFFPKVQVAPETLLALNIPPFIIDEIFKFPLYIVFLAIILFWIAYFAYRSIFVLHFLFLERNTVSRAFWESFALTKKLWHKKLFGIIFKNIFWIFLFILPLIAFGVGFSRILANIHPYTGSGIWLISDAINFLMEFLFIGLSSALFLAGMTIAYIRHSGYQKKHFESRFHFLKNRPEFTPRWKNVRKLISKKYFFIFTLLLTIFSPFFISIILRTETQNLSHPIIISHRWISNNGFIENTISGIIEAKNTGADKVEIDIYENADGTLILSHDADLERIANIDKKISELSDAEIANILLPNNEKIPTLDDVLQTARMYDIPLLIEPKIHGNEKNLIPSLIASIEKYDMISKVEIQSFNIELLKEIKKKQPHLKVGLIIFGGFGRFGATEVDFFSIQERVISRSLIENIHQFEKKIYVWTPNDTTNISRYMKMWVDGIITDEITKIRTKVHETITENSWHPKTIFRIFGDEIYIDEFVDFWGKIGKRIFGNS